MIEKWRVIDESGATHEVDVTSDGSAHLRTNRVAWRIFDRAARCWLKPHASVICRGW